MKKTQVYIVGAGPGEPELLTLKAKQILEEAEVVLHDSLVHPRLLSWIPSSSTLISVGKRKGQHSKQQSEIHDLIKKYTDQSKVVVRLKGGDPMAFGRIGEELAFLTQHNIIFEIIPGVTSVMAAAAYSGIPLTHRDHARSFAVVTGQLKKNQDISSITLPTTDTLVFVMALTHIQPIVDAILQQTAFTKKTPLAIISHATLSSQDIISSTVGEVVSAIQTRDIGLPALLIVGDVSEYAKDYQWRHHLPLFPKRIVLLRPIDQVEAWIKTFGSYGADVHVLPLISITPLAVNTALSEWKSVTDCVFTSANAVQHFQTYLKQNNTDSRWFAGRRIISIGPKTTQALLSQGIQPDIESNIHAQRGICDSLPNSLNGRVFLCPQSRAANPYLVTELQSRGAEVTQMFLYEPSPTPKQAFDWRKGDVVVFSSASTATQFLERYPEALDLIDPICLGDNTADILSPVLKQDIKITKESTSDGVVDRLLNDDRI